MTPTEPARVIVTGVSPALRRHIADAIAICVLVHSKAVVAATSPEPVCTPKDNTGKQKAQWKQETYGRKLK